MIKIYSDIEKCTVKVTGHATNGKDRNPLVCAGVSALVSGLAQNVMFAQDIGQLKSTPVYSLTREKQKFFASLRKHSKRPLYIFL